MNVLALAIALAVAPPEQPPCSLEHPCDVDPVGWWGVTLAVVIAGDLATFFHEGAHIAAALALGAEVTGYEYTAPMTQGVYVDTNEPGPPPRWRLATIGLAGPLAGRAFADLPRWIYAPTQDGFYNRCVSMWSLFGRLTPIALSIPAWAAVYTNNQRSAILQTSPCAVFANRATNILFSDC